MWFTLAAAASTVVATADDALQPLSLAAASNLSLPEDASARLQADPNEPGPRRASFVFDDGRGNSLAVCACAKCGTTSLYNWLYQTIYGHEFSVDAHSLYKSMYKQLSKIELDHGADIHHIARWPTPPKGTISAGGSYDPLTTKVIFVVRDPLDRYRSAWEGKLRCATRSANSETFVRGLLTSARMALSRGQHPIPQMAASLAATDNRSALADVARGRSAWCLSFADFALAMRKIHATSPTPMPPQHMNAHFRPQGSREQCAAGGVQKMTIAELQAQSSHLLEPMGLHAAPFPHAQDSSSRRLRDGFEQEEVSDATLARELCGIVEPEYSWLGKQHVFAEKCGNLAVASDVRS